MFTIKLYRDSGQLRRLVQADFITFGTLASASAPDATAVILHRASGPSTGGGEETYYVGPPEQLSPELQEFVYERCIIENAAGRTTETIRSDYSRVGRVAR